MVRRLLCVAILVITAALSLAAPAAVGAPAHGAEASSVGQPSPTTRDTLAGTTLQAEDRGDGGSPGPWLIGSGVAAVAVVALGGSLLKRRMS